MKTVQLSGSRRANVGKKGADAVRKNGQVPGVIYGGKEQVHVTLNEIELGKIVWSPNVYEIKVVVDGSEHRTIIQDIQFHPVTDKVVHIDFLELNDNKKIKVKLPVKFVGAPEGVKKGGKLIQNFRKLHVSALPGKLPDFIEVNIDHLNIGDGVRIRELNVDGLTFLDNPAAYLVAVQVTRNVEAETPAADAKGAAPAAKPAAAAAPAAKK
jgi:large subunit ribosomal protein L25